MSQATVGQLARLMARANLKEGERGHISQEVLQAFLEGTLVVEYVRIPARYFLPPFDHLSKKLFSSATAHWDGRQWEKNPLCADQDFTRRELRFSLMPVTAVQMNEMQIITWAMAHGYRVANHLELLDYVITYPEEQRKYSILALGSFVNDGHFRMIGRAGGGRFNRTLDAYFLDNYLGGDSNERILLVQEESKK
jgi:hypothetical protein